MRMNADVWAGRWAVDGEGGGGDGGTFDAKYLKYIEAVLLIRNIGPLPRRSTEDWIGLSF